MIYKFNMFNGTPFIIFVEPAFMNSGGGGGGNALWALREDYNGPPCPCWIMVCVIYVFVKFPKLPLTEFGNNSTLRLSHVQNKVWSCFSTLVSNPWVSVCDIKYDSRNLITVQVQGLLNRTHCTVHIVQYTVHG